MKKFAAYVSTGRFWAYVGLVLGAAGSLAANVRHTYLAPEGAPADWAPGVDAIIAAVFWPVALFVGLEVLARSKFGAGWGGWAMRLLGVGPVTLVAGIASYEHLHGLLVHLGEADTIAQIGPIGVDGLMLMCSAVLVKTAKHVGEEPAPVAVEQPAAPRPVFVPRPRPVVVPTSARLLAVRCARSLATPAPVAPPAPRPTPVVVPPGVRLLPAMCAQAAEKLATVPESTPDDSEAVETLSEGNDADVITLPLGRPTTAAETRRRYDALKARYDAQGRKLTQTEACEKYLGGLPRRTLRDHLAATEPATELVDA